MGIEKKDGGGTRWIDHGGKDESTRLVAGRIGKGGV